MLAYICNRCGKIIGESNDKIASVSIVKQGEINRYDLCDSCNDELKEFMKQRNGFLTVGTGVDKTIDEGSVILAEDYTKTEAVLTEQEDRGVNKDIEEHNDIGDIDVTVDNESTDLNNDIEDVSISEYDECTGLNNTEESNKKGKGVKKGEHRGKYVTLDKISESVINNIKYDFTHQKMSLTSITQKYGMSPYMVRRILGNTKHNSAGNTNVGDTADEDYHTRS